VVALLDRLGLADRADHHPRQLSGGEQQPTAIAFVAIGPPGLLVADEPTGQLDHHTTDGVVAALRVMATTGGGAGRHPRPGGRTPGRPGDPAPRRTGRRRRGGAWQH
jgi:hypothetical protein